MYWYTKIRRIYTSIIYYLLIISFIFTFIINIYYNYIFNLLFIKITGSVSSKKKFIGCNNWRQGEKDHRYLTIPDNIDLELLESMFNEYSYHANGIDFEVSFFIYLKIII